MTSAQEAQSARSAQEAPQARPASGASVPWEAVDPRRLLQLALAAIWVLDGVLQYQAFMFTRAFGEMLAGSARGNPAVIADPITWAAGIVTRHPVPANVAFATIQLLIGLGIACRPTVRLALAASVGWSLAVWWLGEGLGGVLSGGASLADGAPGAVILYALLAVLIWPVRARDSEAGAARLIGPAAANTLWLVLWGSVAYFAAHQGSARSIALAVPLVIVAAGVFLPRPARKAVIVLAITVSLLIWAVAQDFGGMLTGASTDPNSGPLLVLIALAYWPLAAASPVPAESEVLAGSAVPAGSTVPAEGARPLGDEP